MDVSSPDSTTAEVVAPPALGWAAILAVLGPGLIVMLADTDAGSVITAAQSGAQWGYRMILPQLLLIPPLYFIQEITVRLGAVTGQGHGTLIRRHFGLGWALLSASTLFMSGIGALVAEFAGIAGVGELFHVSRWFTVPLATAALIGVGLAGSYSKAERIGIAVGLFELAFIPAALMAHPDAGQLWHGVKSMPFDQPDYVFLLAANVGAVIMPWMIFYQQGAVIDKRLGPQHLRIARWDTAIGAVLTQVIMIAIVVALAAAASRFKTTAPLDTVGEIAHGLIPVIGWAGAKVLFGLGVLGAALTAALVASLAGAWGISEVFGWQHSLSDPVPEARIFYWIYSGAHIAGAILVLASVNLVRLTVDVEVMNAMLLPIVLGFLLALEARVLPRQYRMRGVYKYVVWGFSAVVMLFGIYMGVVTLR
ncbi:MAG: NRAMP family divalent metal transporter [Acidiferrobacteraceae bacterium]